MNYSIWDTVLYQMVLNEKTTTQLLNCSWLSCEMEGAQIAAVTGWQLNSYTFHTVRARIFLDCSGDSILADLTGAACRVGREGQGEFDEYGAPEKPDRCTMGSSCLIEARKTDHPVSFIPPEWAYVYPDDESMYLKNHDIVGTGVNFWWIELGGEMDTIHDAQAINEELIRTAYGIWDHIKNRGDHGMENWELEWIGFLPGKRESRRYEGEYILNQRDLEEGHTFPDAVAFGGWTMDNHSPLGFKYPGYSSRHITPKVPYQIPFRSLYSRNVPNLMFAGRNISATHMAMSSTRVMATCAVIGQAAGTGAALAIEKDCLPNAVTAIYMEELQNRLLEDGCFIPGLLRSVSGNVTLHLDKKSVSVLENGWERPYNGEENRILLPAGSGLTLDIAAPARGLRLVLDPDFSRESISVQSRYQKFAMRTHIDENTHVAMPATLLKSCTITARTVDGEVSWKLENNRQSLLRIPLPAGTTSVTLSDLTSWGETIGLFSCDTY